MSMKHALLVMACLAFACHATFNYCGEVDRVALTAGSQNILAWDLPGVNITITCVELSTTGPADVTLSVACSDQIAFNASAQYLNLGPIGSNTLWNPTTYDCPISGYFYIVATSRGAVSATYGGYGTVGQSGAAKSVAANFLLTNELI
jgi:hypothetical protein